MKAKKILTALTLAALLASGTACSNNDDSNSENNKIENTHWVQVKSNFHNADNVAVDKIEENSIVTTKIKELQGLKYIEESDTDTQGWFWDLCEIERHDCDSVMTASFSSNKCIFHVEVSRLRVRAKLTKTEKYYKFTEGSYTVRIGYSNHFEQITVNSDGVYRADRTLFIPFYGKKGAVYETDYSYTDKQTFSENMEEYTIVANYQISNNQITFTYNKNGRKEAFRGLLSQDGKNITFDNNPIVNSVKSLKNKKIEAQLKY